MSGLALGYSGTALISQGTAYGLICGLGAAFCGVILVAIKVQKLYLAEDSGTSEMFMVANRSVGTGLTASAVFSSWMWINETVFAAVQCYRFGIAIPMVSGSDSRNLNAPGCAPHCVVLTIDAVVGSRSLFSDCSDGSIGCTGKNPRTVRTYFSRDNSAAIWKDRTRRVYCLESLQQCIRMRIYDLDRLTNHPRNFRHAFRRRNHIDSSRR